MLVGENVEKASWIQLDPDEEIVWIGRPSKVTLLPSVTGGLVLILAGILLYLIIAQAFPTTDIPSWALVAPVIIILSGIVWIGYTLLNWLRLLYVITDEEIYVKYGLISRDVTHTRLQRVQNTNFEQSAIQRLFGFGTVQLFTAGTGTEDVTLANVPNPERLTTLMTRILREKEQHRTDGF